ncbi:hypothetical protein [Paenalcaligenes suwonensis]|uniref:hypothetical protein n=1 Tax=Paenalcaligenes suwonensis TaxID=1202713 RepID=UPI00140E593E|nr:hypothetical protein [Paenalcaligenes suwonensis]NHC61667.1 hypothetical protein [Paenalcaligenes suwonensis]
MGESEFVRYEISPARIIFAFQAAENQRVTAQVSLYALERLVGRELRNADMCIEAYALHKEAIHSVVLDRRGTSDSELITVTLPDVLKNKLTTNETSLDA